MKNMKKIALAAAAAVALSASMVSAATISKAVKTFGGTVGGEAWKTGFLASNIDGNGYQLLATQQPGNFGGATDNVVETVTGANTYAGQMGAFSAPVTSSTLGYGDGVRPNGAWFDPPAGLEWIGYKTSTNGSTNFSGTNGADKNLEGYYVFQLETNIVLPQGATLNSISFDAANGGLGFSSDNRTVAIFLNETPLGFTQTGGFEKTYGSLTGDTAGGASMLPVTITFIVENNVPYVERGNPTGLLLNGLLTADFAPAIPLPTAVWGGLALMGMVAGQRMRRSN